MHAHHFEGNVLAIDQLGEGSVNCLGCGSVQRRNNVGLPRVGSGRVQAGNAAAPRSLRLRGGRPL
eukprot:1192146-Pleurochrysis_carterae.AAC.1